MGKKWKNKPRTPNVKWERAENGNLLTYIKKHMYGGTIPRPISGAQNVVYRTVRKYTEGEYIVFESEKVRIKPIAIEQK